MSDPATAAAAGLAGSAAGQLPALAIVVPLVAAPLCVIARNGRLAWWIAFAASGATALVAWNLLGAVEPGRAVRYAVGGWAAPAGIELYVDYLNAIVLMLVAGISTVALVYARRSIEPTVEEGKRYLFWTAWLLCLTGLLGITITGDAFNVFVFLEISSLSTYMLVSFGSDRRALSAAFRYVILGSVGASFILIGVGFLYAATGTLNMVDLAHRLPGVEGERTVLVAFSFLTIGLMIKAAVFPLHAWLANAYQHAPVAATVFLAGTATKVSLYVLVRFFHSIFGVEYSFGQLFLNTILLPAAVAGFTVMSLVAVFQTDLRRLLAFSSVAQIGYIVAGIALATEAGIAAGFVHVVNHGIVKAALFMATGCLLWRLGHVHVPSFEDLFRRMPLSCAAFALAGLGIVGVPLTAGFVSKFALVGALLERGLWPVVALVMASSLLAVVYVGRVLEAMLFRKSRAPEGHVEGRAEAPVSMLAATWLMIAAMFWVGTHGDATLEVATRAAADALAGLAAEPVGAVPVLEAEPVGADALAPGAAGEGGPAGASASEAPR